MTSEELALVVKIAEKYGYGQGRWNRSHAEKVADLTQSILQQFVNLGLVSRADADFQLARAVALLHDIGRNPDAKGTGEHNQRGFETLKAELNDSSLSQSDIAVIQYCALFHTGDEWRYTVVPTRPERIQMFAGILRIADSLDCGLSQKVKSVVVKGQPGRIVFEIVTPVSAEPERDRAYRKSDLLKTLYGRKIEFV